ncbi:unnamed protein product [Dicrocoelium dendriticum]|nr:unnamed protein product [Dicrocoelium dendriticum]
MSFALADVINVAPDSAKLGVAGTQSTDILGNAWVQQTSTSSSGPVHYSVAAPFERNCPPHHDIYQRLGAQTPNHLNSLHLSHLFPLTGIEEDSCVEFNCLKHSVVDTVEGADPIHSSGLNSTDACAAPAGMCFVLQGMSPTEESGTFQSNAWVTCTNSGCNYGGLLHHNCFQRWVSCCELRCRMLASSTGVPTSSLLNGADANAILEALFVLYQCPRCGKCSLRRFRNCDITSILPEDPIPSVLDAVQFVSEQLTAKSGIPSNGPISDANFTAPQISLSLQDDAFDLDSWMLPPSPKEAPPNLKPHPIKRASWHTTGTHSVPVTQQLNQETQLLRRLSLHRGTSTGSASSGGTSGFVSGTNGGSSVDSSRRGSQNAYNSDGNVNGNWSTESRATWAAPSGRARNSSMSDSKTDKLSNPDPQHSLNSNPSSPAIPIQKKNNAATASNDASSSWQSQNSSTASELEPSHRVIIGGGSGSRKHHNPTSAARGPSFWPTDSTAKSKANNSSESDKRKTVNRKGNIFQPRPDFNVFENLPAHKRNAYFIQMDDDSCTGNEDTRAFLLTQLTNHRLSEVRCLACHKALTVYDHFPVVDGIFFISPVCHDSDKTTGLRITWHTNSVTPTMHTIDSSPCANANLEQLAGDERGRKLLASNKPLVPPPGCLGPRQQLNVGHLSEQGSSSSVAHSRHCGHSSRQERYLHALCMGCLEDPYTSKPSAYICCRVCDRPWSGSTLLVGGLYTYDILAASPCCLAHLTCNKCGKRLDQAVCPDQETESLCGPSNGEDGNPKGGESGGPLQSSPLPFFSQYSQLITCPFCAKVDYHFAKPIQQMYRIVTLPTPSTV